MPELPEVETIRRDLVRAVLGRRIAAVRALDAATLRGPSGALVGGRVLDARRRAKTLLVDLDNGYTLAVQLLVYGQLLLEPAGTPDEPHLRLALALDDGTELRLADESGYARAHVAPTADLAATLGLDRLGPEALGDEFTVAALAGILRGRRGKLKPLLLDQHALAGLGNIYVDEALFAAGLHPERVACSLTEEEIGRLYAAIRSVLAAGLEHRGTTFDTYRDLFGRPGTHQRYLAVFQRTGRPCPRCGSEIARSTIGGRATYTCPRCQVPPAPRPRGK